MARICKEKKEKRLSVLCSRRLQPAEQQVLYCCLFSSLACPVSYIACALFNITRELVIMHRRYIAVNTFTTLSPLLACRKILPSARPQFQTPQDIFHRFNTPRTDTYRLVDVRWYDWHSEQCSTTGGRRSRLYKSQGISNREVYDDRHRDYFLEHSHSSN